MNDLRQVVDAAFVGCQGDFRRCLDRARSHYLCPVFRHRPKSASMMEHLCVVLATVTVKHHMRREDDVPLIPLWGGMGWSWCI
jgi:hypothetical protein